MTTLGKGKIVTISNICHKVVVTISDIYCSDKLCECDSDKGERGSKNPKNLQTSYVRGLVNLDVYEVCHSVTSWSRSCYYTSYERGLLKLPYEVW